MKQESLFYWRKTYSWSQSYDNGVPLGKIGHIGEDFRVTLDPKPRFTTADVKWNERDLQHLYETEVAAFTVAELGDMLPEASWTQRQKPNPTDPWFCLAQHPNGHTGLDQHALTEADARAKMIIYLIEHNLITA